MILHSINPLYNKQQLKKKELDDYDGSKFPIHKGRKLEKDDLDEIEEDLKKWVCEFNEKL